MGSRRAHEEAAVAAARAAVVAGFAGTSTWRRGGGTAVPTDRHGGARVHAAARRRARRRSPRRWRRWARVRRCSSTRTTSRRGVRAARSRLPGRSWGRCGSTRVTSAVLAAQVRAQLDAAGARSTRITVSSRPGRVRDRGARQGAGRLLRRGDVGGDRVRGADCGMVYKLVAREGSDGVLAPVAKAAFGKVSVGGRKAAARRLGADGRAVEEVLVAGADDDVAGLDVLRRGAASVARPPGGPTASWIRAGWAPTEWVRAAGRHRASRDELPRGARRLSDDEAAVPTVTLRLGD